MKKLTLLAIAIGLLSTTFAQNHRKNPALGFGVSFIDFNTAAKLRSDGISSVFDNNDYRKLNLMSTGLYVNYINGITGHLDFVTTLTGTFLRYPIPGVGKASSDKLLADLTAVANLKLLSDRYIFTPYIATGVGASKYGGYYGAFIPLGWGFQVNISDEAYLLVGSQYRIPVTPETVEYHLYHSVGFAGNIYKRKVAEPAPLPPPPVEVPKDTDGDGVLDINDKCPDVAGVAALQGCPDQDGDGITDSEDACPTVAGLSKYKGCPIPDTDKDGINDEMDDCPTVAGVARYKGCPVPDTDKDGINDEEDKCPNEAGVASNYGCPVIEEAVILKVTKAAQNIFFTTGSAKLLAKSNASLNSVAAILKDNPSYNVDIDGHTDNTGKPDKNQVLSESRAASVKAYLVSKGIAESRLVSTGYGIDKPIADNKTVAGRAKNRRVEMKLRNY